MSSLAAGTVLETPAMPPIAIVGLSCLFPRAADVTEFWSNIRRGVDAISEVPATHWNPDDYYAADPKAPDMTYARRGGFLSPVAFDPLEFGIAPNNVEAIDTSQLLGLVAAKRALDDAGYGAGRVFDRSRVACILGVTGTLEMVIPLGARLGHPKWRAALSAAGVAPEVAEDVIARISESYVPWQENSFPGLLGNVVAGRIANRLDLHGTNCVVDAACASSLSAVHLACLELASGRASMAVTGGVDTFNDIFMFMCFSKTPALSPTGDARPFSDQADGTILGEGVGMVVLKRLDHAQRDGDRVYGVIRGIGTSSDGAGLAVYAPKKEGQIRCLNDAYQVAGVSPTTIELVEAHGTGTKVGDATEISALVEVYGASRQSQLSAGHGEQNGAVAHNGPWCAVGSVKSQIGHTKAAAGVAGLLKTLLALSRRVIPPTVKVDQPPAAMADEHSPFYVNTVARPWMARPEHPRRAALSAFGFGGSNFHCVLEEAPWSATDPRNTEVDWDGRVQLVTLSATSRADLLQQLRAWDGTAEWAARRAAARLSRERFDTAHPERLTFVIERDVTDLAKLVGQALAQLERGTREAWSTPEGAHYGCGPRSGQLGILFPGQGAQYVGMLRELACTFPELQTVLSDADRAAAEFLHQRGPSPQNDPATPVRLSDCIYPQPAFSDAARARQEDQLRATQVAQPAIGAISLGALSILERFGVTPEVTAGHSYGELTALCASARFDRAALYRLSMLRGRLMADTREVAGGMLAVGASLSVVEDAIREHAVDLVIANRNAPNQMVLSGRLPEIERASDLFARRNIRGRKLAVAAAFHSPLVAPAGALLRSALEQVPFSAGRLPVYANSSACEYPAEAGAARDLLAGQLAQPVEFVRQIENMHAAGVRLFVEVGPGAVLTGLVSSILSGRDFRAIAVDASSGRRSGHYDLAQTLAVLASGGYAVKVSAWDASPLRAGMNGSTEPVLPAKRLTIPLSGANYVKPRAPRPPLNLAASPLVLPDPTAQATPLATSIAPVSSHPEATSHPAALPAPLPVESFAPVIREHVLPEAVAPAQNGTSFARPTTASFASTTEGFVHSRADLVNETAAASQVAPMDSQPSTPVLPAAPSLPVAGEAWQLLQELATQTARLHEQFLQQQGETLRLVERWLTASPAAELQPPAVPAQAVPAPAVPVPVVQTPAVPAPVVQVPVAPLPVAPTPVVTAPAPAPVISATAVSAPAVSALPVPTVVVPAPVVVPAAPLATVSPVQSALGAALLQVVAEKTGYPAEMLSLEMSLDQDLGIDSIKRVEILSALQEKLPELPAVSPDQLGSIQTLADIVRMMGELQPVAAAPAVTAIPAAALVTAAPVAIATPAVNAATGVLSAALLAVVAEKTGYPAEMLSLEMSLDQDLGIDSIKRVEILSALQEKLPELPAVSPDQLGSIQTLADIVRMMSELNAPVRTPAPAPVMQMPPTSPPVATVSNAPATTTLDVRQLVSEPLSATGRTPLKFAAGSEVWITDDGSDWPLLLASQLQSQGVRPRVLSLNQVPITPLPAALSGLIVLATTPQTAPDLWAALAAVQAVRPALRSTPGGSTLGGNAQVGSHPGDRLLAAVVSLDGEFGLTDHFDGSRAETGGLAGLIKTARHEWPDLCCKVIDVAPAQTSEQAATAVAQELLLAGPIEVGFGPAGPVQLKLTPHSTNVGSLPIGQGDVVIVTGGGRGVTSAAVRVLAQATQATFVLWGRSSIAAQETASTAGLTDRSALRHSLIAMGASRTPRELEQTIDQLLAAREIRATLAAIEAAGGQALYETVDVQSAPAVATAVSRLRQSRGPIRGIVHGAGVLHDRRIEDKTRDQFERVYQTKVLGLQHLLSAIEPTTLRALVLFSSFSGRFGRTGQVDYAMANESLNKLGQSWRASNAHCQVVSFNWGPWAGGMVTPALEQVFRQEGIGLIPVADGAQLVVDGLRQVAGGARGPVERTVLAPTPGGAVNVGDATNTSHSSSSLQTAPAHVPTTLLPAGPILADPRAMLDRTLHAERDAVLANHVLGGHAVLPVALQLEWCAQGAMHRHPGLDLLAVRHLKVLRGAKVGAGQPLRVQVLVDRATREGTSFVVPVQLISLAAEGGAQRTTLHSTAKVVLGQRTVSAEALRPTLQALGQTGSTAAATSQSSHAVGLSSVTGAATMLEPVLLSVVADKTGYPVEMLSLEMSLDQDLGIDSIKRVEILSALQEKLPQLPAVGPDQLGSIQTLADITRLMGATLPATSVASTLPVVASAPSVPAAGWYEQTLFHGPLLQGLRAFRAEGQSWEALTDRCGLPATWTTDPARSTWLTDPLVVDVALQALIVWTTQERGTPSLPAAIASYEQYLAVWPAGPITLRGRVETPAPGLARAEIELICQAGQRVAKLTGVEHILDAGLSAAFRQRML